MKKGMSDTTLDVLAYLQKKFKAGHPMTYQTIGDALGFSRECARRHAGILRDKRAISIKGGHIVGVK